MSLNDELLLQRLPWDILVVDCSECGHLTTTEWGPFQNFGHLGLHVIGRWRARRDGHRVPVCRTCDGGKHVPGPGLHRPEGQAVPIWRELKRI